MSDKIKDYLYKNFNSNKVGIFTESLENIKLNKKKHLNILLFIKNKYFNNFKNVDIEELFQKFIDRLKELPLKTDDKVKRYVLSYMNYVIIYSNYINILYDYIQNSISFTKSIKIYKKSGLEKY